MVLSTDLGLHLYVIGHQAPPDTNDKMSGFWLCMSLAVKTYGASKEAQHTISRQAGWHLTLPLTSTPQVSSMCYKHKSLKINQYTTPTLDGLTHTNAMQLRI